MVENSGNAGVPGNVYLPSEIERLLIAKNLGDAPMYDSGYKSTVTLKQEEAQRRFDLVSDIEYDFQLALNIGDYYVGKAVVNFYLDKEPKLAELFLNFNAIAITDLAINDKHFSGTNLFENQKIKLELPNVCLGWNTVQLRYLNAYNKN